MPIESTRLLYNGLATRFCIKFHTLRTRPSPGMRMRSAEAHRRMASRQTIAAARNANRTQPSTERFDIAANPSTGYRREHIRRDHDRQPADFHRLPLEPHRKARARALSGPPIYRCSSNTSCARSKITNAAPGRESPSEARPAPRSQRPTITIIARFSRNIVRAAATGRTCLHRDKNARARTSPSPSSSPAESSSAPWRSSPARRTATGSF